MSQHGAAIDNYPVEVEVKQNTAVLYITSFTVIPNSGPPTDRWTTCINKLNQMSSGGYYACSYDGKSAFIKYVQQFILCSSQKADDAIKQAVGEGIIHIRAAVSLLLGGEMKNG